MKAAKAGNDVASILIAGDTCPVGRNEELFRQGNAETLLGDLLSEFKQTDISIANLECPLIQRESPIDKVGPNLGAPVDCVKGLKAIGVDIVGLANNHTMDHGPQGLQSTIDALDEQDIAHVGAGRNVYEARKILVREVRGIRIGVLAVAEYEFGVAAKNSPGANPLNVIDFLRNVQERRSEFDALIVLVHAGNEYYPYPRPGLVDTCRFYVEQGASAVICQQSHCVGCVETYQGAPIIYGQGNFLFDMPSQYPEWHVGCLLHFTMDQAMRCEMRMIPFRQADGASGARRMSAKEEANWRSAVQERSRRLAKPQLIEQEWRAFCDNNKRYYLNTLHGKPGLLRRLAGKLNLLHHLDSRDIQRTRLHLVRCESLREALITVLTRETG